MLSCPRTGSIDTITSSHLQGGEKLQHERGRDVREGRPQEETPEEVEVEHGPEAEQGDLEVKAELDLVAQPEAVQEQERAQTGIGPDPEAEQVDLEPEAKAEPGEEPGPIQDPEGVQAFQCNRCPDDVCRCQEEVDGPPGQQTRGVQREPTTAECFFPYEEDAYKLATMPVCSFCKVEQAEDSGQEEQPPGGEPPECFWF